MGPLFGTERYAAPVRLFELQYLGRERRFRNEATVRGLCHAVYLGDERLLCRVLGRYKMFVDSRDVGLSSHLLLEGYWEMWLTEALAEMVKPGMTVVDIGANLGYFTLLMAELVGADGHVHAFEPNARMTERMRQSVAVNGFHGRVIVHEQALADGDGSARLLVPDEEPKNGFLIPAEAGDVDSLVTRRLDSYPELATADIIKIDADTSEQAIWRGMSGLLAGGRPLTIFLEYAAARYADPGGFIDEIVAYGFTLAWLTEEDGIQPVDRATILAARPDIDLMLVLSR